MRLTDKGEEKYPIGKGSYIEQNFAIFFDMILINKYRLNG